MELTPGIQSALDPQGPHADAVATLAWIMFAGGGVVLGIVVVLAAYALWGPREHRGWMARNRFVVWSGIAFPAVVLVALFMYSLVLSRSVVADGEPIDLRIEVVAHQWWWRVNYLDSSGALDFATANELRIPAGKRVELVLKSADVIHSFWVPSLAGKLDMIPGHVNRLQISASKTGVFRGQCAEYCGGPHALMAFYVVALGADEFERWRETERAPAAAPAEATTRRGRELFLAHCSVCHAVRGTPAKGTLGPDLTHVAARVSIGAGVLPNNRANLARWVISSQDIKPGNLMPSMNVFAGDELRALTTYVMSLR